MIAEPRAAPGAARGETGRWTLAILGLIAGAVAIAGAGAALGVPAYVLPPPGEIFRSLIQNRELLGRHAAATAVEVLWGFVLGSGSAVLIAILVSPLRPLRRAVLFLGILLRSIPVIALTPVLALWLGTGIAARVVVVALLTFFLGLVVTMRGLMSADPLVLEWMETLRATRWQILLKVRIPSAVPHILAGLRAAAPIAVFAALTAEWLSASQGIGHLMAIASYQFRTGLLWSAIVVAAILGAGAYAAVVLLERFLARWSAVESDRAPSGLR